MKKTLFVVIALVASLFCFSSAQNPTQTTPNPPVASLTSSVSSVSLRSWLLSHGSQLSPFTIGHPEGSSNRFDNPSTTFARPGLYSTVAFKSGDTIAEIPFSLALHVNASYPSQQLDANASWTQCAALINILTQHNISDPHGLLALRLAHEQLTLASPITKTHLHTKYAPLIQSLFVNTPAPLSAWADAKLTPLQLEASSPILIARQQHQQLQETLHGLVSSLIKQDTFGNVTVDLDSLGIPNATEPLGSISVPASPFSNVFPNSEISETWFAWAYQQTLTTAIELPTSNTSDCDDDVPAASGTILAIVPLVNMMNHANPPHANAVIHVNIHKEKIASISIHALKDIPAGQQMTLSYGSLSQGLRREQGVKCDASVSSVALAPAPISNTHLLLNYGVALPVNTAEAVSLDAGVDADVWDGTSTDKDKIALHKILTHNHLPSSALLSINQPQSAHSAFIQALRAKNLTPRDLAQLSTMNYDFNPSHGFFSLQNELRTQLELTGSIENLLSEHGTLAVDLKQWRDLVKSYKSSPKITGSTALISSGIWPVEPTVDVQALAYRIGVKTVLHDVVLSALNSIQSMFADMIPRWKEEWTQQVEAAQQWSKESPENEAPAKEWKDSLDKWQQEMGVWENEARNWQQSAKNWHEELVNIQV